MLFDTLPLSSAGSSILRVAYGYTVKGDDDPLVKIVEEAMIGFSKASEPGSFLVDRFPFCKKFIL